MLTVEQVLTRPTDAILKLGSPAVSLRFGKLLIGDLWKCGDDRRNRVASASLTTEVL